MDFFFKFWPRCRFRSDLGTFNHCNLLVFGTYQHNVNCFKLATTRGTNNVLSLIFKKIFFWQGGHWPQFFTTNISKGSIIFSNLLWIILCTCRILTKNNFASFRSCDHLKLTNSHQKWQKKLLKKEAGVGAMRQEAMNPKSCLIFLKFENNPFNMVKHYIYWSANTWDIKTRSEKR